MGNLFILRAKEKADELRNRLDKLDNYEIDEKFIEDFKTLAVILHLAAAEEMLSRNKKVLYGRIYEEKND